MGPDVKKNPISLLPNGSVLKGVLLPRYDVNRNLVGDLRAETMTLIDEKKVQGENVLVKFYNPDQTLRGKVFLKNALFDQERSRIRANELVEITNDRLVAKGGGIIYNFETGVGFLKGPATTWIKAAPNTTMNFRALPAAAIMATSLVYAAPPKFVSESELAAIKEEATAMKPVVDSANQSAATSLAADTEAAQKASKAAHAFVSGSGLKTIANDKSDSEPEAKPLDIKPSPDDTIISCDGGMYFDADEGVLVYLKNVKVTDPRFTLSGANELKIIFDKKEATEKKEGDMKLGGNANFGDVKKLVATGAVRILQKSVGGKAPVEASGGLLTYSIQSGEIIISERYPWVKQGTFYARAKEPNLTLRLLNDGSFSTQGNWEMGGNLNLKGQ